MDELDPQIKERFESLPAPIRNTIANSGWERGIRNIVSKHNLRIDQGSAIEMETLLVMLGFESPDEYVDNISKEAEITQEVAEQIATEAERDIFNKLYTAIVESTESFKNNDQTIETKPQTKPQEISTPNTNPTREDLKREMEEHGGLVIEDEDDENEPVEKKNSIVVQNMTSGIVAKPEEINLSKTVQNLQKDTPPPTPTTPEPTYEKMDPYREPIE